MSRRSVLMIIGAATVVGIVAVASFLAVRPQSAAVSIPGLPVLTISDGERFEARTEQGALLAAETYLESTEEAPALGPQEAANAQRAISTSASADRLASEIESVLTDLLEIYPHVRIRIAPIESRITADGPGWRVSIWYVETYTLDDVVIDDWRTVTYTLLWERDQWLIDNLVSVRGPVPARSVHLEPDSASHFEQLLDGFTDHQGGR